jgi:hypothetical protein
VSRGWAAASLADIPRVAAAEPAWYPLQHVFGFTAFGANAFVAAAAGDVLVDEHDERTSGQEELYLVVAGRARFELDDESVDTAAVAVVAVRDSTVKRRATALVSGTVLVALGAPPRGDFTSTWRSEHFDGVSRVL